MRWSKSLLYVLVCAAFQGSLLPISASGGQGQPPSSGSQPAVPQPAGPQQAASASISSPTPSPSPGEADKRSKTEFFVMIDPGHGGVDKGAVFSNRLEEKNVTLSLARELRKELQEHGIPARLLRDSDVSLDLESRAEIANQQRSGIYVALHAGQTGSGVRVYSSLLPPSQPRSGNFLPWESAQAPSLEHSALVAKAVTRELQKKEIYVSSLASPLRPLNNVIAPAIAIEFIGFANDPKSLESQTLQNKVASAIASGIAQIRSQLGGHR